MSLSLLRCISVMQQLLMKAYRTALTYKVTEALRHIVQINHQHSADCNFTITAQVYTCPGLNTSTKNVCQELHCMGFHGWATVCMSYGYGNAIKTWYLEVSLAWRDGSDGSQWQWQHKIYLINKDFSSIDSLCKLCALMLDWVLHSLHSVLLTFTHNN